MSTKRWRERAEWATLVTVICTAGYVAQARAEDADNSNVEVAVAVAADADAKAKDAQKKIEAVVEAVKVGKGDGSPVQVQIHIVGPDGKDVDVDDQPAVRVIKKIVRIGDEKDEEEQEHEFHVAVEPPSHYLGIHGGEVDPILRKHLKLGEGQGILVMVVVDDSPADKAGLEEHDILLAANGKKLAQLNDLVEIIRAGEGDKIELKLIRQGKRMSRSVTPAKRPKEFSKSVIGKIQGFDPNSKDLQVWLEKMQNDKNLTRDFLPHALRLRTLGPGVIIGEGSFDLKKMPGNLKVSISKKDDNPANIKIQKGDKTWEFTADDEQAIEELPDDIRTFVEPMLGNAGEFHMKADKLNLFQHAPHGELEGIVELESDAAEPFEEMMERMEEMEKQLEALRDEIHRLHGAKDKD